MPGKEESELGKDIENKKTGALPEKMVHLVSAIVQYVDETDQKQQPRG